MNEWKKVKLGDCISTKKGFAFKSALYTNCGVPVVRVSDFTLDSVADNDLVYYPHAEKDRYDEYVLNEGDVLIQTVGSWQYNPNSVVGKVVRVPYYHKGSLLNQNIVKIIPNNGYNNAFIFYRLKCRDFAGHVLGEARGAANQASITLDTIKRFSFDCPLLSTQQRIATILSRYDSLIENYRKQIKLLEEAAQRLYKEWFIDLRFPGHENTKIVDGVPEGWEKKKVKEVCDTTSGGTPSRSKTEFYTGDILWVKTKELNDDFIFDTEEKITEDAIRNSSAKMVPSGSILMAMYGATIGKLGIATKELSCNQACCVFLLPEDSTLRLYLYNWLLNSRTLLISMGKGAAQPNLSQDMIKNLEVVVPSSCLLAKFDSKVKPLYRIMSYHSFQLRLLTEARDRLLPKLMSGAIEV